MWSLPTIDDTNVQTTQQAVVVQDNNRLRSNSDKMKENQVLFATKSANRRRLQSRPRRSAPRFALQVRRQFFDSARRYSDAFIELLQVFSPAQLIRTRIEVFRFRGRDRLPRGAILTFRSDIPIPVRFINRTLRLLEADLRDERVAFRDGSLLNRVNPDPPTRLDFFRVRVV